MSNITIEKTKYMGWDNCIKISNGIIDTLITTDVGPRILKFSFTGKENVFCEVADQLGKTGGDSWTLYGGHRLWTSPEFEGRANYADNESVEWTKENDTVILKSPVEKWTNVQKEIEVTMLSDKPSLSVLHRITNKGAWPIDLAAWAISVMAPGGREIIPQITKNTGYLPNRSLVMWSYSKFTDKRLVLGDKYVMVDQDSSISSAAKFGMPNDAGWAAYAVNNQLYVKHFEVYEDVEYPDNGCSYETYTCDFMTEMESLSPIVTLEPGDYIEHKETWELYGDVSIPQTENDVDTLVEKYIK